MGGRIEGCGTEEAGEQRHHGGRESSQVMEEVKESVNTMDDVENGRVAVWWRRREETVSLTRGEGGVILAITEERMVVVL